MATFAMRRCVRLTPGLLATALLHHGGPHSANSVHCDSDGNHSVWSGAYIDQFDPDDPETWQHAIVEQGLLCCALHTQYDLVCEGWIPGDPEQPGATLILRTPNPIFCSTASSPMPTGRRLLTALFFGSVPAAVFASGVYLDPATLAQHGMPVSLAALGILAVGFMEFARTA